MANQEHLKTLHQGVEAWNSWRTGHENEEIDLSNIELKGYNFSGINLSGVNLLRTTLEDVKLNDAILEHTDLTCAHLVNVDLTGAKMNESNLTYSEFRKVNLTNATLVNPVLDGTRFEETIFDGINLFCVFAEYSTFNNCDFSKNVDLSGLNLNLIYFAHSNFNDLDLSGFNGIRTKFHDCTFSNTNFNQSEFYEAEFVESDISNATMVNCNLSGSNFQDVNLSHSNLENTDLTGANFTKANLTGANLTGANLQRASLIDTIVEAANFDKTSVYGVSVWNLQGTIASENDLVITKANEAPLMVDNIKVAQFIYLILNNQEIRDVINTIADKGVLILGRFKQERKEVLDAIKDNLRDKGYLPILFDFEPSEKRNLTETVQLLANMSKFIIADLTEAKSIPQELSHIIPNFPSIPVAPILLESDNEYAMFEHWNSFNSVLKPIALYKNSRHLIENMDDFILNPVNAWINKKASDNALLEKNEAQAKEIEELKAQLQKLSNSNTN